MFGYISILISRCRLRMAVFWDRHPAFFMGVCLYVGAHAAVVPISAGDWFLLPFLPLVFSKKRFVFALVLFLLAIGTTCFRSTVPKVPGSYIGTVTGHVLDRRPTHFHGKAGWVVWMYISKFETPQKEMLFSGITAPLHCQSPSFFEGGFEYAFAARLVVGDDFRLSLRVLHGQSIEKNGTVVSLAEWRVRIRRRLEQIFAVIFPDHDVRNLARTLTFALEKDDLVQEAMHRCGVEHVLAVSGFHFGIIAALLLSFGRVLERCCSQRVFRRLRSLHIGTAIAIILLTAYLLIIGPLPSVLRAYTACFIALMATCCNRHANSMQALGCGLIVAVLFDPLSICSIGFELSFLSTLAIVLFSKRLLNCMLVIFPQRMLVEVAQFSAMDQFLRLIVKLFMPVFSLSMSVMILLIPYELTYLQDFSLMGVLYNMLIPALFSLAMPCILCAVLTSPLPILAMPCAFLASIPIQCGLSLVRQAPILRYSMVDGALLPVPIGRLLIMVAVVIGMILIMDEKEDCSWKACL